MGDLFNMFNKKPATINKLSYSYYPLAILNAITKHLLFQYVLLTKKVTNIRDEQNTLIQGIPLIWKTLLIQGRLYNITYTPKQITNEIEASTQIYKFITNIFNFNMFTWNNRKTTRKSKRTNTTTIY